MQCISDIRKTCTAAINNELKRLHIDIAALQEAQLADSGCLEESNYILYWQGKKENEVCKYGVGFAVRNPLLDKIQLGASATDRLISLQLNTTDGSISALRLFTNSHGC